MPTYYVSLAGSDANNGTSEGTAWQTITKVNGESFLPGDTIRFRGGDTFAGNLLIQDSGTVLNPITFNSYGTGRAVITPASGEAIEIRDASYVIVENLRPLGVDQAPLSTVSVNKDNMRPAAIYVSNTSQTVNQAGITIRDNEISAFVTGIFAYCHWDNTSRIDDLVIEDNHVHDVEANGIMAWSDTNPNAGIPANFRYHDSIIRRNKVHDCRGYGIQTAGVPIALAFSSAALIERNVCHTSAYDDTAVGWGGAIGIFLGYAEDGIIQHNEVYAIESPRAVDGDGINIDKCRDCIVQYNYTHNNEGSGIMGYELSDGNHIRFNLSVQNAHTGELLFKLGTGTQYVYHNTLVRHRDASGNGVLKCEPSTSALTIRFYNNIFVAPYGGVLLAWGPATISLEGNLYYKQGDTALLSGGDSATYNTLAELRAAGYENHGSVARGFFADPNFVEPFAQKNLGDAYLIEQLGDNYRLVASSPAVSSGLDLTMFGLTAPTQDLSAQSIPASGVSLGSLHRSGSRTLSAYAAMVMADNPKHYVRCNDPSTFVQPALLGGNGLFLVGATASELPLTGSGTGDAASVGFNGTAGSYAQIRIRPGGAQRVAVEFLADWTFSTNGAAMFEAVPSFSFANGGIIALPNWVANTAMTGFRGDVSANKWANTPWPSNGIHHYVFIFDPTVAAGDEIDVYIDGVAQTVTWEQGGASNNANTIPDQILNIFGRNNAGQQAGRIQEFAVYVDNLPSAQRIALHAQSALAAAATFSPAGLPTGVGLGF